VHVNYSIWGASNNDPAQGFHTLRPKSGPVQLPYNSAHGLPTWPMVYLFESDRLHTQTHQTDRYTWPLKRSVSANITNEELRIFISVRTYHSRTVKRRGSGNSPVRHTDLASTIDHIPSLWCPRQHGDRPPVSEWWPCRSLKGGQAPGSRDEPFRWKAFRVNTIRSDTGRDCEAFT